MEIVVIHYHEVALKGRNRSFFENKLMKNIRYALRELPIKAVQKIHGRMLVEFEDVQLWEEIKPRLQKVCGIANYARGRRCSAVKIEDLCEKIGQQVLDLNPSSFAVRSKRSDKTYPFTSPEINGQVGAYIQGKTGWPVRLKNPDLLIQIEMLKREALFYTEKIQGPGGLPVGVSRPTLCMLSGGIDSPVAAYRLLKRGSPVDFVHFHSFPFTDQASLEKVHRLAESLAQHRYSPRLYTVPFGEVQKLIVAHTPSAYRIVLYRRFMIRIAEKIARQNGILALVTGESLGQVASQTLENLTSVERVANIPILRPLIGMDKQEIIWDAQKIATFEISIEPHQDCCTYMMPQNPAIHTNPMELAEVEQALDVEEMVAESLAKVEVEQICPKK